MSAATLPVVGSSLVFFVNQGQSCHLRSDLYGPHAFGEGWLTAGQLARNEFLSVLSTQDYFSLGFLTGPIFF